MRALLLAASAVLAASFESRAADATFVDASKFTSVTVEAPSYDSRLAAANGCDPAGCEGLLTRDGDKTSLDSRWSCKPALSTAGSPCSITYTLADSFQIYGLNIAMYKGDERTRTMDVYVDGVQDNSWTSSGTTTDFETMKLGFHYTSSTSSYTYDHPGVPAKTIELRGVLGDSEWLSIMEVEILVEDGSSSSTTDTDTNAVVVEAGALGSVTAAASTYDARLSSANGCDPAGCTAALTRDGALSPASRWSCAPNLGSECTISYDLGIMRDITELRLAMYKGDERQRTTEVYVDGVLVTTWTSSGTTTTFESIDLSGISGEVVEITGVLEDSEWLSIVEVEIMVLSDGTTMPPSPVVDPTPAPASTATPPPPAVDFDTPAPTPSFPTPAPTTPEADGDLMPVGLIPLATASPATDLEMYYVKDGDLSTSWTCFASTQEHEVPELPFFGCTINFDLFSYRHIKEVKIAMPDGADRAIGIRIAGRTGAWYDEEFLSVSGTVDGFVMSSGQTDGLESYDFDFFTDSITISAVFTGTSSDESFSVSEVEFVEEVFGDQIRVVGFSAPRDLGDGAWTTADAFEWTSDSPDVVGESLSFSLNNYADVTAIELRFPEGDSYKFDVELYNDAADSSSDDLFATVSGLESNANEMRWQTFDVSAAAGGQYVTVIKIVMQGTGSGAPGFNLLDARIIGTAIENPTGTLYVASARVEDWDSDRYPDFVAAGSGDQTAFMGAICAVKKASFDGIDCVGDGDETATGKIMVPMGDYFVDGNIFMKSGVYLRGWFSSDDQPGLTRVFLEEDAGGKTDVDAILVMDNIADAMVEDIWIRGLYDPEIDSDTPVVPGLGTTGISVVNSQNITCKDMEARYADGDAMVVRNSNSINIDAGNYVFDFFALDIGHSRGTGLVVDSSDSVYVRRHDIEMNGVAGIQITGSNNFTFEGPRGDDSDLSGQAFVGKNDGLQQVQVVIESSTLVTFKDIGFFSDFEPAMTVSADSSGVTFDSCSFSSIDAGACVIQVDDSSVVATGGDDELTFVDDCFLKV